MDIIEFQTRPCPHCRVPSIVKVSKAGIEEWQEGAYIQDALPDIDADTREMIKTGFHPQCWDIVFSETED